MSNATITNIALSSEPTGKTVGAGPGVVIYANDRHYGCSWCYDTDKVRAAFLVAEGSIRYGACVKHVIKYFGMVLPDDFRPVQYATEFRMCMVVTAGGQSIAGGWETYPNFDALFKASREITQGGYFEQIESGSNAHYRRTGHHRMVFGATERAPHLSRSRVIIHVVVK